MGEIAWVHGSRDIGGGHHAARRVRRHLQCEGLPVAHCAIERLMRQRDAGRGSGRHRAPDRRRCCSAASLRTDFPLDALDMAPLRTRSPEDLAGLVHHSDVGSQYISIRYSERLAGAGASASIGISGNSFNNALAESTIGLYKTECVRIQGPFLTVGEAELATLI